MRQYIEDIKIPKELIHLNKGDSLKHKLIKNKFNIKLLEFFTVDEDKSSYSLFEHENTNKFLWNNLPNYLASYQKQAIINCLINDRWGLFLSPGSGKTVVICEFLNEYLKPHTNKNIFTHVCIIAPKTLHKMWKDKLKEVLGIDFTIREISQFTICNVEYFYRMFEPNQSYTNTIFIYDESGMIVTRDSKRYQKLKLIFGRNNYKKLIFCTGSPFSNKIIDIWPQLNLLYPEDFSSYWDFAKIFHFVEIDRYGWKIKDEYEHSLDLLKYSLSSYVSTGKLEDYVELPQQIEKIISVDLHVNQLKIYNDLENNLIYKKENDESIYIDNKLDLLLKLKKVSSDLSLLDIEEPTSKLNFLYNLLETVVRPCVIFGTFNRTLKKIAEKTGGLYFAEDGDTPNDFLSGKNDLLVAQIKSGKFGLSFNSCRTVIFYDYNFDSDDLWQAKHRVRRFDSTESVIIYYLVGSTIDKVMLAMNKKRNNSLRDLLSAYTRETYEN